MKIEMTCTEKHPTTGDTQTRTVSNTGGDAYNTVAVTRTADTGYKYTNADFRGYAGGELKAALFSARP